MIIAVPIDLRERFYASRANFIRDICCVPMEAIRPFFRRRALLDKIYHPERENPFDEQTYKFKEWYKPINLDTPRYMHFDLAYSGDALGLACCHASHYVERKISDGEIVRTAMVPYIHFDFLGRIQATKGEEIILEDVVNVVNILKDYGIYLRLVTFDGVLSVSSRQTLKREGYTVARLSIDRTAYKVIIDNKMDEGFRRDSTEKQYIAAMQSLKNVIYQTRGSVPKHPYYLIEAKGAEHDERANKVDHLPTGSIDMLQAMAGACFNCENNSYPPLVEDIDHKEHKEKLADTFYDEHNYSFDRTLTLGEDYADPFYKQLGDDFPDDRRRL